MKKNRTWGLVSLASIPLIMTLGNSMLIPVLPTISRLLHVTSLQVSLLVTVYAATAIVLIPIAGYLSDRVGRKKVIIPSLIITAVGGTVSGLCGMLFAEHSYYWILLGRFLQGIGAAGAAPIVLPFVGDMMRNDDEVSRGLGLIETSNTFGKVLSPIVGSVLALWFWFLPFLAIPVFCSISLLLVLFLVKSPKEDNPPVRLNDFLKKIRALFKLKGRWLYAIFAVGGICMFVIFGMLFYLSSRLEEEFGVIGVWKGLILAIPLASLCAASYLTGKKVGKNKRRMKWVTFFGMTLAAVSIFVIGWIDYIAAVMGALFVGGIGIGCSLPSLDAMITEGIEKEERGTISSIYSSMRFIGVSTGPPAASLLETTKHHILFFTFAGISAAAALLALTAIRPKSDKGRH